MIIDHCTVEGAVNHSLKYNADLENNFVICYIRHWALKS